MLHLPQAAATAALREPKYQRRFGFDLISADIQPLQQHDEKFKVSVDKIAGDRDVKSLVCLYDAFIAADAAMLGILNQPRCGEEAADYLGYYGEDMWARAYYVASVLKNLKPKEGDKEIWCETLIRCAFAMGWERYQIQEILTEALEITNPANVGAHLASLNVAVGAA